MERDALSNARLIYTSKQASTRVSKRRLSWRRARWCYYGLGWFWSPNVQLEQQIGGAVPGEIFIYPVCPTGGSPTGKVTPATGVTLSSFSGRETT